MSGASSASKCKACEEEVPHNTEYTIEKNELNLVHPKQQFCSPECSRYFFSSTVFKNLSLEHTVCVAEQERDLLEKFSFSMARTQDNTLASMMAIAHTLFTTD